MKTYHITSLSKDDINNYPKALLNEIERIKKFEIDLTFSDWLLDKIKHDKIRLAPGFTPVPEGEYSLDLITDISAKQALAKPENPYGTMLQFLRLAQGNQELLEKIVTNKMYLIFPADQVRDAYGTWSSVSDCYEWDGRASCRGYWGDGGVGPGGAMFGLQGVPRGLAVETSDSGYIYT